MNAIGILASAIVFHAIDTRDHNPAVTVILFTLLALSAYGKLPVFRWKPLMIVSTSSYALYLFHNNLGCLIIETVNNLGLSPLASFGIGIGFAFGFGIAYTYWFEMPFTSYLRERWKSWRQPANQKQKSLSLPPSRTLVPKANTSS